MNLIPVESLGDPRVADYANLRDAELMQRADPLDAGAHKGLFIAEGELVLRRLVTSAFATKSVLTTEKRLKTIEDALGRLPAETPVYLASQEVMNGVVGFNMHRGVLAIGRRREDADPGELLKRIGPFLILEDTVNHDNLGGVFRNAAALGGPGCAVLLSPRCADPLYRKSLRVSMGHVLSVPYARLTDWPEDIAKLRAAGVRLIALTPRADAADIGAAGTEIAKSGTRVALMLGSEGPGLTDPAMAAADILARIPMHTPEGVEVDSLNVHVAAAIALHRLVR